MLNIVINGACGRMGRALADLISKDPATAVTAGVDLPAAFYAADFPLYASLEEISEAADVIIDFSAPAGLALEGVLSFCNRMRCSAVLAATAYSPEQEHAIKEASGVIPIFRSANMSVGFNALLSLVREAARMLPDSDIEIIEKHHNTKADSPSGAALMLADSINDGSKQYEYGRHSKSRMRQKNEIGIHSIRGGTITGDHDVLFISRDEVITLSHSAQSRQIFATGALNAAKFVFNKPAGLYNMNDLLHDENTGA